MFAVTPITEVKESPQGLGELDVNGRQMVCYAMSNAVEQSGHFSFSWWKYRDCITDWSPVNKQGKLIKRISKLIKKMHNIDLSDQNIGMIGEAIAANTFRGPLYYDITDCFDWKDGDFADGGSCFWGGRSSARFSLEQAGSLALRFYSKEKDYRSEEWYRGIGRCWMAPHKKGWVLFNAYGPDLEQFRERVKRIWPDLETTLVNLSNYGRDGGLIYINRSLGLYVLPKEIAEGSRFFEGDDLEHSVDLRIEEDGYDRCRHCQEYRDDDDLTWVDGDAYCNECLHNCCCVCLWCDEWHREGEGTETQLLYRDWRKSGRRTEWVCNGCLEDSYHCGCCDSNVQRRDPYHFVTDNTDDDELVCNLCLDEGEYNYCEECDLYIKEGNNCQCQEQEEVEREMAAD